MSNDKRKKRVLHFAVTGALLVTPAVVGCDGGDAEEPHTNVAAGGEDPDTNVAAHEDGEPHTNVAHEDEHTNVAAEEEPHTNVPAPEEDDEPMPTANPAGD